MNVPILRPLNPTSDSSTLITLLLYEEIKETIYICVCVCIYRYIYIYKKNLAQSGLQHAICQHKAGE